MEMDINMLRSVATVVSFVTFIGIVWWTWSRQREKDFSQAANLPFVQDGSADKGFENE
jgi:cytochrome c oxidase cbb3-type subunit IV